MNDLTKKTDSHDDDEIDLLELIGTLLEGKWLILLIALLFLFFSFIYAFGKTPIYRADALLQVESEKAGIPGIEELAGLGNESSSAGTELEILKSRKITGSAITDLKLNIKTRPKTIPLLSNLSKRFVKENEIDFVPFDFSWLDKYTWSNERIGVNRFEVSDRYLNKPFTLISQGEGQYELFFKDEAILQGRVNQQAASKDETIKINIQELHAGKNKHFIITRLSNYNAIVDLQRQIQASEKGKNTGIIRLALEGENKDKILKTLDSISNSYLLQNKTRSSEEASNALNFLNEQIKPVKERSETTESALKEYRTNNQTANMSMETQAILQVVSEIDTEFQQLSLKRDDLTLRYTANHPTILALTSQEKKLTKRRNKTLSEISALPETQQQLLKLEGEYKVANNIYIDILNKIQEFKIAKASQVGNVYILDTAAVNERPVKPKKPLILALGTLLGLMFGTLIVFLRKAIDRKVSSPEKVETELGLPVYATIPLSKGVKLTGGLNNKKRKQKTLLAIDDHTDPAIESLRSLRASLHFAMLESKNNIVMITGPSPGIGKSFVSSNLAAVIANSNQKVLLIDADMRKGYLHKLLDLEISPGLSDLISEKTTKEEAIRSVSIGDYSMDVITRGQTPPNPSELLMHNNFENLLKSFSKEYDLVLIDTPPVHAVTDPSIVGRHAGVTFMVLKHDEHSMKEIEHAISRLSHTGVETKGFIFNGYIAKKSSYGYSDYGYQSYYGDYKSEN